MGDGMPSGGIPGYAMRYAVIVAGAALVTWFGTVAALADCATTKTKCNLECLASPDGGADLESCRATCVATYQACVAPPDTSAAPRSVAPAESDQGATPSVVSPAAPNSEAVTGAIEGFSEGGWPVIHGQAIRIFGIASLPVAGRRFRKWLAANVIALTCEPRPSNTYRCLTQNRVDLAQAVLINGGSSASSDAPQEYLDYQQQARDAKRGIWGSALR